MAKRLATEVVNMSIALTEDQLPLLLHLFTEHRDMAEVKVFDNGCQEVAWKDGVRSGPFLALERVSGSYLCHTSCIVSNQQLVEILRRAIVQFRGDAVMRRIYPGFAMVYHFKQGIVERIVEEAWVGRKLRYEYRDTMIRLEQAFRSSAVECEILAVHAEIDALLDKRKMAQGKDIQRIDKELAIRSKRLFLLEG